MGIPTGPTTATLEATVHRVRSRNLTFLAGSLAYNAFVSLIPILLLVLLVAGRMGDARLTARKAPCGRAAWPLAWPSSS